MDDRVLIGDCQDLLPQLPEGSVDLCATDPPFNIGYRYDVYEDRLDNAQYLDWTARWLAKVQRVLKPTGSLFVAIGIRLQAEVKVLMDRAGFHWRNTIPWHYTFGPQQQTNFSPSWVAIHYATKDPKPFTFNAEGVRVPSARQLKYNDRRAVQAGKVPNNVWVLLPDEYGGCFQAGQNAWLEACVCGTFRERRSHPCQMPEAVMERIIRVASNPGELVLDPFAGSGTTLAAAKRLHRHYLGMELSAAYARQTRERLAEMLTG